LPLILIDAMPIFAQVLLIWPGMFIDFTVL
jgi:hypothetical protein